MSKPSDKVAKALKAARLISAGRPKHSRRPGRPSHEDRLGDGDDRALLARARLRKEAALAERHEIRNELLREQVVPVAALNRGWMLGMTRLRKTFEKLVVLTDDHKRARRIAKDGIEAVARDIERAIEEARAAARGSTKT